MTNIKKLIQEFSLENPDLITYDSRPHLGIFRLIIPVESLEKIPENSSLLGDVAAAINEEKRLQLDSANWKIPRLEG